MIAPGDVLHNRYRIEHSIGRGGMGEVFSAVVMLPPDGREEEPEVTLLRPSPASARVAVKVVSRSIATDDSMARLAREATAASRIRSPFIPELIDVGTTPEGEVFLAMEILYGETLTARLKARPFLHWDEVFLLGDDVLSGLIDAHEAGVVHRDLKPSNIFLCLPLPPDTIERTKILDFGVCKLDAPDEEKLTGTGEAVGTVAYMAPEQIRGASHVTVRADLYSFATVIFETLSGELPHIGVGQMAVLASKLERNPLRLSEAARTLVPEGLEALLARLLSRDPSARFGTASEVRDAWRALGPAVVEPRMQEAGVRTANASAAPPPTETIEAVPPRGSRTGLVLGGVSVGVACVALCVLLWVNHHELPPTEDFSATVEPVVSASVVDRPPAPFLPVVEAAPQEPPSQAVVDSGAPPPSVKGRPKTAGRPPSAGHGPTRPHIADKPRY